MDCSVRLKLFRGDKYVLDTIFTYNDDEKKFDLSDGDLDSYFGDLEEWCFVKYSAISELIKAFAKENIKSNTENFNPEQNDFYNAITNSEVKKVFPYILNSGFSMKSFIDFLKKHNIEYEYSAYSGAPDYDD